MARTDFSETAWQDSAECMRPAPEPDYVQGAKVWVRIVDKRHMEYDRTFWKPAVIVFTWWGFMRVELADGKRLWVGRDRLRPIDGKEEDA